MGGDDLLWLARAFERHVVMLASRGHRKTGRWYPFNGANEAAVILIADRIFSGLGFYTWPECRMYEYDNQRADLWAESADGCDAYMVEGKVVWDGGDQRLNRKRFLDSRELLGDFDRLSKATCAAQKIVVWIGLSSTNEIVSAGDAGKSMRLGDAISAAGKEFSTTSLQAKICVNFEKFCDCGDWKFAHVLCWAVK